VLGLVLGAGILLQAMASMVGTWGVGAPEDRIPPAWAVVNGSAGGAFRVLWLGPDRGELLPTPAGDPRRRLEAGPATVRYALTDRDGASVLDAGRPLSGPGPDDLDRMLDEILGATTRHGGALLASFGIRYVVAERGALPQATLDAFDAQVDIDLAPPTGLTIYRNAAALPPDASLETQPADEEIIASADPSAIARWRPVPAVPLREVPGGWDGPAADGTVFLSTEHDDDWMLEGSTAPPDVAFGWATSFPATGGAVEVRHGGALPAKIEVALLTVLWLVALWVTRKPVAR